MDFGVLGVSAITIICYLAGEGTKATNIDNKWIPIVCGCLGAILGVIGMYIMPDFPAGDIITAMAVGVVSGLAATGVNQLYKQLTFKKKDDGDATDD